MRVAAILKSHYQHHEVSVSTDERSKKISIASKASGYGSSVNGAELLLLSLATCFCNDIYREANKRNIPVSEIEVECMCDFGAEGEPGTNFRYQPKIKSNATPEQIAELIAFTDSVAEIHKTLRQGVSIALLK